MSKTIPKPLVLVVCDGWGVNTEELGNAILAAQTPHMDRLMERWPHTEVSASGEAVGLPEGQQGNSEVGHLTIGGGRVIHQPLSRQNHEIKTGLFYQNEVLARAIELAKQRKSAFHIMGLVSPGGVHSHSEGALATARLAKHHGLASVYIHAFTDGRDTAPTGALEHVAEFEAELEKIGVGQIVSVAGRYYAMDRDNRWERVEEAYRMLVDDAFDTQTSAVDYIRSSHADGVTDEFIRPMRIAADRSEQVRIEDGDVVVFFNFRPDRARQIARSLVDAEFSDFLRSRIVNDIHLVGFAEYDSGLDIPVAFPKQHITKTLAEVVSDHGMSQYHVAETEKYAHVTYFFNGGREESFAGEDRQLIPSPKVATYDQVPAMSAREIADDIVQTIKAGEHDLIIANFANADMVGHTGNFEATKEAIEVLDECLGVVADAVMQNGGALLMTADHGNAEFEIDVETGAPLTSHTTSPVPVLVCGKQGVTLRSGGSLADIAPTVLDIMQLPIPSEMTGKSLLWHN